MIVAEIEYVRENGESVHSDIDPPEGSEKRMTEQGYREYLHTCLDEWLDKSGGTGGFYIKNEKFIFSFEKE